MIDIYEGKYKEALKNISLFKYDDAKRQIKYLLSIPGFLPRILQLDPGWALSRNQPEFKKMMESYYGK